MIVVTKSQELDNYKAIIDAGHIHFGENKVQEASRKWSNLIIANDKINLHLLGKLQSNKIKEAFNIFTYFHSLADKKLANLYAELDEKGCYLILTNSNSDEIINLYKNYKIDVHNTKRNINSIGNQRVGKDIIVTNFK